jgi:hypothetical protein
VPKGAQVLQNVGIQVFGLADGFAKLIWRGGRYDWPDGAGFALRKPWMGLDALHLKTRKL